MFSGCTFRCQNTLHSCFANRLKWPAGRPTQTAYGWVFVGRRKMYLILVYGADSRTICKIGGQVPTTGEISVLSFGRKSQEHRKTEPAALLSRPLATSSRRFRRSYSFAREAGVFCNGACLILCSLVSQISCSGPALAGTSVVSHVRLLAIGARPRGCSSALVCILVPVLRGQRPHPPVGRRFGRNPP
jgi:hypothetical protein